MNSAGWVGKTKTLDAKDYDRYRPTYPTELFTAIQNYVPITSNTRCLEIGIGTGQATESFLAADCKIVALEPAANLREFALQKYDSHTHLEIRSQRFEDIPSEERFDVIYAATSFHWVKGPDRMQRLLSHLNPGGCVALSWIRPRPLDPVRTDLRNIYISFFPDSPKQNAKPWSEADAKEIDEELRSAGLSDIQSTILQRERTLTTGEYIGLLHTYSDHLDHPDEIRIPLMERLSEVIDAHGGYITIHDTIDLHLGRNHI